MLLPGPDEVALADAARGYLSRSYDADVRRRLIDSGAVAAGWAELQAQGWLGLCVPEMLGGSACDAATVCSVLEAFGRALHLAPVLPVVIEAASLLATLPSAPLRDELLTGIVSGSHRPVVVLRQPSAETGATVVRAIQGAASATHLLIPAAGGVRLRVLDASAFESTATRAIDGSDLADIVVLTADEGPSIACRAEAIMFAHARAHLGVSAWLQGIMEAAIANTAGYVAIRQQFGRTLASFQAVRHRVADMRIAADAARAAMRRAAHDGRERLMLVSYQVSVDAALTVTESAIQLHGGIGMTDDLAIGQYYKTALRLRAGYGSADRVAAELGQTWLDPESRGVGSTA